MQNGTQDAHPLAQQVDELRPLQALCRNGRVYEVEDWIAHGKPLQLSPDVALAGGVPKSALTIAVETGQHSLATLLLRNGYKLELERRSPLELAIQARHWDIVDLLMEHGADPASVYDFILFGSYNSKLYERFWSVGYDFTDRHALAGALSETTSNRPLFGFAKRHRLEDSRIQNELNIALAHHARAGNAKGVSLCVWAGADPHEQIPEPGFGDTSEDPEDQTVDDLGWSAIEDAAHAGHASILKRLGPSPDRDDFENLYRIAGSDSIVTLLRSIRPPTDLTSILSWQVRRLDDRFGDLHRFGAGSGTIEAVLKSGVCWCETDRDAIAQIRKGLLQSGDYALKCILSLLRKPEICAPSTYQELIRTTTMRERAIAIGAEKKPVNKREQRRAEIARLSGRYDRAALYKQVWSQPVQHVARSYGVSGVALAKACRKLRIPVPPRGYWARVRNGEKTKRPPLPKLSGLA